MGGAACRRPAFAPIRVSPLAAAYAPLRWVLIAKFIFFNDLYDLVAVLLEIIDNRSSTDGPGSAAGWPPGEAHASPERTRTPSCGSFDSR